MNRRNRTGPDSNLEEHQMLECTYVIWNHLIKSLWNIGKNCPPLSKFPNTIWKNTASFVTVVIGNDVQRLCQSTDAIFYKKRWYAVNLFLSFTAACKISISLILFIWNLIYHMHIPEHVNFSYPVTVETFRFVAPQLFILYKESSAG